MKKIILIISVSLLAIVIYAYDSSIETTGTEKEKNFLKELEKEYINEALELYQKNVEKKKAKGETVTQTKQDVTNKTKAKFNYDMEQIATRAKKLTDDVNFFGRVVDLSSNPIANVTIPFKLTHYNIFTNLKRSQYKCYSDENGYFEITDAKGLSLSFDKPIKECYEYVWDCRAANRYNFDSRPLHYPDPNKPVLFIMRKIPEKALMIKSTASPTINWLEQSVYSHQLGSSWEEKYFKEKGYFQEKITRIKFTAHPTSDENVYKITFELEPKGEFAWPNIETQKIIDKTSYYKLADRNSEIVNEAPLKGYQPEISVIFTNNTDTLKGLCFIKVPATKNITLYGKLIFRITNDADEPSPYINLRSTTYLNIEETRNLLYGDDLNYFEKLRIEEGEEKAKEYLEEKKKNSTLGRQKRKVADEYKLYK